jgi:hypothetical protein
VSGPILHIGCAKAASTFLQDIVFPKLKTYRYVPLAKPVADWKDDVAYTVGEDPAAQAVRQRSRLEAIAGAPLGSNIVVSYEGLSIAHALDGRTMAEKLRAVFGEDLTVLIILREQRAWLRSMFLQTIKQGDFRLEKGLTGFLRSDYWDTPPASLYAPLTRIDYAALVSSYVETFGRERTKVFLYEEFTRDPRKFASDLKAALSLSDEDIDLADFQTEKRVNQTQTVGGERALRIAEKVLGSRYRARTLWSKVPGFIRRPIATRSGGPIQIPDEAEALAIAEPIIRDVNRRLAADHGLPVADYGYLL